MTTFTAPAVLIDRGRHTALLTRVGRAKATVLLMGPTIEAQEVRIDQMQKQFAVLDYDLGRAVRHFLANQFFTPRAERILQELNAVINIETLKTGEIVALYNKHADKPIKKFETREKAIERTKALLEKVESAKSERAAARAERAPRKPRERKTDRAARGGDARVVATVGEMLPRFQKGSQRHDVFELIAKAGKDGILRSALSKKLGYDTRGHVQKLAFHDYVKVENIAAE